MNDAFSSEYDESVTDLSQNIDSLFFWEWGLAYLHVLFQIGVAEFLNDVVVIVTFHNIENLDDVLGFQHLHDLYF